MGLVKKLQNIVYLLVPLSLKLPISYCLEFFFPLFRLVHPCWSMRLNLIWIIVIWVLTGPLWTALLIWCVLDQVWFRFYRWNGCSSAPVQSCKLRPLPRLSQVGSCWQSSFVIRGKFVYVLVSPSDMCTSLYSLVYWWGTSCFHTWGIGFWCL